MLFRKCHFKDHVCVDISIGQRSSKAKCYLQVKWVKVCLNGLEFCHINSTDPVNMSFTYYVFVTRYSKRYLTALPTSYWFGINTFSHKRAAVFSSQEVHDIIGCKL